MSRNVIIKSESGLHARPAGILAKVAKKFQSEITIEHQDRRANAKSIMNLMALGLKQNTEITLVIEGADEAEAMEAIVTLIENDFQE